MKILPKPLQTAMRLIKENRLDEASDFLHQHLASNPRDDQAWYVLAYLARSKHERIESLKLSYSINPQNHLAAQKLAEYGVSTVLGDLPETSVLTTDTISDSDIRKQIPDTTLTLVAPSNSIPTEIKTMPLIKKRPAWMKGVTRFGLFSVKRLIMILITIFFGVFLTVLIINRDGIIEQSIHDQILVDLRTENSSSGQGYVNYPPDHPLVLEREYESGLHQPYLSRQIRWTLNFLTLNWGEAQFPKRVGTHITTKTSGNIREIVLFALPNTLLLMAAAYFITFIFGIPLATYLSRHNGKWLDRFFSFLSPLSSIPSWVIGILLILIIAVQFRLLPISGMYDDKPPLTQWGYIEVIARHMALPVLSIVISLFFQLVYNWRTYFLLFSEEEYVELAIAKGLSPQMLHRKYILRPGIPYVLTSFALTFVSFWQTTTALEVVFHWPGIGYTYINSLPNFFGESMYPGDLMVSVAIVVMFAYLLGMIVFILDIIYAIVDPRIRFGDQNDNRARILKYRDPRSKARWQRLLRETEGKPDRKEPRKIPNIQIKVAWKNLIPKIRSFWTELIRYPSAIIGLTILLLFIIGSFYAVFAYPYKESGRNWYTATLTGQPHEPRLAKPIWVNFFRKEKLPPTISLNSALIQAEKQITRNPDGNDEVSLLYTFEYPYGTIPQDVLIYYKPTYEVKKPFAVVTWITPDGEEYIFKGSATSDLAYRLSDEVSVRRYLMKNPEWETWFSYESFGTTANLWTLFAVPNSEEQIIQKGTYQVRINALMFEEQNDLDAELLLLGQVFGLGGTDFMRRDLMFPLLWGLPYVIFFGLFGAVITTVLALIVAAMGVWFGGWVDDLIQRITEANMILPILAISILLHVQYGLNMTIIITAVILMNVFSTPTKSFRAAFLQIKDALYIEAAQVYGASNSRLIFTYMIPRILPVIIPHLVVLIPAFIFLEATFGLFNIRSIYPTWGRIIYEALREGAAYGSRYWVMEPLFMLLLTAFAFTLLGTALDRVLNPKLKKD